jgi:hypothetical protein
MTLADVLNTPVRRMGVLIRWLPPDAAVWHDTPASWSLERELSAATVELLGEVVRGVTALGGVRRSSLPPSVKVPRIREPAEPAQAKFDPIAFTAWLTMVSGGERT